MKKVILDESKCIGCGYCFSTATENFKCNDEGRASLISDIVTEEAIEASEGCPVSAITIEANNENNEITEETKKKCNCNENCECGDDCNCNKNCECGDDCNCNDECNCGCKNKTNE